MDGKQITNGTILGAKLANYTIGNTQIATDAAIAYSKLSLTTSITNGDIATNAAIAYSKLSLALSIVNGDIATGAAIAYSKLSLSNSIVNADVASAAAIDTSKLALAAYRWVVPHELTAFTPSTSSLLQDLGSVEGKPLYGATISTGSTAKGVVVLKADNNLVPRGVKREASFDDVTAFNIDSTISDNDDKNQSIYMRLTNTIYSSGLSNVTGVTMGYIEQGTTGGDLAFTFSGTTLTYKTGTPVAVATNGLYTLDDGSGHTVIVKVVAASLPGEDKTDTLTLNTSAGVRGAFFYRKYSTGVETPLITPGSLFDLRLEYPKMCGLDDLPKLAFFGVGNSTDGIIAAQHTHALTEFSVTATAAELNVLDGFTGSMGNLNTLVNGSNADLLHTHTVGGFPAQADPPGTPSDGTGYYDTTNGDKSIYTYNAQTTTWQKVAYVAKSETVTGSWAFPTGGITLGSTTLSEATLIDLTDGNETTLHKHTAANINIVDSADKFTATQVEAALLELYQNDILEFNEPITVTAQDTIASLSKTPSPLFSANTAKGVSLFVNGMKEWGYGASPSYAMGGTGNKDFTWTYANAGYHVETTDKLEAVYPIKKNDL